MSTLEVLFTEDYPRVSPFNKDSFVYTPLCPSTTVCGVTRDILNMSAVNRHS